MIPAPLQFLLEFLGAIQQGHSVSASIRASLKRTNLFENQLRVFLFRFDSGRRGLELSHGLDELNSTALRKALITVLEKGLTGAPVFKPLAQLKDEMLFACEQEFEQKLQILPLKMLIPLLLGFYSEYILNVCL
jgi:hypothetical protein